MTTSALRYPVLGRSKDHDFGISNLGDFTLGNGEAFDSERILADPRLSLYTLDLERDVACFVELPDGVALDKEPFFFRAQFLDATHLVTLPLEDFNRLADAIHVDDSKLVFIQSVGRCGSTLVSRVFEAIEAVHSLSEPDAFTILVAWRGSGAAPDGKIRRTAESCVRYCCRPAVEAREAQFHALKFRSQCLEIDDLLAETFPAARHLYLTREPITWLDSFYRAFVDPSKTDDEDYRRMIESVFAPIYPLVQNHVVEGEPMPVWKSILLNWIANRETFRRFREKGMTYCVADFSELKNSGGPTIARILDYCGITVADWSVIDECLARDSQKGSGIDQALINDPVRHLPEAIRRDACDLLAEYGYADGQ